VNREELIRALKYDRGQYDKGYADGVRDAEPKWIPVTERLPEQDGKYLVCKNLFGGAYITAIRFANDGRKVCKFDFRERWENVWYEYDIEYGYLTVDTVTHWMPLPEPPNEVE
jgi:hypothetical protein